MSGTKGLGPRLHSGLLVWTSDLVCGSQWQERPWSDSPRGGCLELQLELRHRARDWPSRLDVVWESDHPGRGPGRAQAPVGKRWEPRGGLMGTRHTGLGPPPGIATAPGFLHPGEGWPPT